MSSVDIDYVSKRFGRVTVFEDLKISIEHGEFVALLGPSGCGKTTLLRCIAGLEVPSGGDIRFAGKSVVNVAPADRKAAMVFQSYALYPHKTVAENMGFALKIAKEPAKQIQRKVLEAAEILNLSQLLDKRPRQLSGGQRQRVAIGRAIVRQPEVFLFDEPLSNLDAVLRVRMRLELMRLHQRLDATMIYVTHDQAEAMTMADRIVVLDSGCVRQFGTPREVFDEPNDLFVAQFIGTPAMNIFRLTNYPEISRSLSAHYGERLNQAVNLGVRPQDMNVVNSGPIKIPVHFDMVESLGREQLLHGQTVVGDEIVVSKYGKSISNLSALESVSTSPENVHLFDGNEQRITPISM